MADFGSPVTSENGLMLYVYCSLSSAKPGKGNGARAYTSCKTQGSFVSLNPVRLLLQIQPAYIRISKYESRVKFMLEQDQSY